jgi:hypothetical protein
LSRGRQFQLTILPAAGRSAIATRLASVPQLAQVSIGSAVRRDRPG